MSDWGFGIGHSGGAKREVVGGGLGCRDDRRESWLEDGGRREERGVRAGYDAMIAVRCARIARRRLEGANWVGWFDIGGDISEFF